MERFSLLNGAASMNAENESLAIGAPMPRLSAIHHAGGFTVCVVWAEGERAGIAETIDLAPQIMRFRLYAPLRADPALFAAVHLTDDGTVVAWTDGIDMAATTVERLAQENMTNAQFRTFIARHKLTLDGAAAMLGIGRRQAAYYAKDKPVPRLVALACAGVEAGLKA
jgi:hypothetical protein